MKRIVKWVVPPNDNYPNLYSLAILTVCDDNFFHYAASLIKSADIFSKESLFVLHLINPSKETEVLAVALTKELLQTNLLISKEVVDLSEVATTDKKTYYASARFFRIPELLTELCVDVLCLDSDSLILNNIDYDFTNKDEADICLIRRDLTGDVVAHLAVATGSIYSRCRRAAVFFYNELNVGLMDRIDSGYLPWFTDQVLFAEKMYELQSSVAIRNIKKKYADWTFRSTSIVWSGKGDLKKFAFKFVILQNMLSINEDIKYKYLKIAYDFSNKLELKNSDIFPKIEIIRQSFKPVVTIYLPRLDLPWKKFDGALCKAPLVSEQTLNLRIYWKRFCILLSNALEREGLRVEILEIPAWEITADSINNSYSNFAFVPHRCRLDFNIKQVSFPIYFFMQEFYSWLFTVDRGGWSAASSIYPINYANIPVVETNHYSKYEKLLANGELQSKFKQIESFNISDLVSRGELPRHDDERIAYQKFIFFPLQVPHDQSIKYFSNHSEIEVITALLQWSQQSSIPVVFKPHPANPKSMEPLLDIIRKGGGYVCEANIHNLIHLSNAVYTINSGVGFEALLHNKPIVTFGRVEYDCVTFKANMLNFEMAWIYCLLSRNNDLKKGYAKFFNWFMHEYAFDLSDSDNINTKLRHVAKRVKKFIISR